MVPGYLGNLGIRVFYSPHITTPETVMVDETVSRTWRERLLTRPWRPWVTTKTVKVERVVHKPAMYRRGNDFYAHPAFKAEIDQVFVAAARSME